MSNRLSRLRTKKGITLIKLIGYILILSIVLIAMIKITQDIGGKLKEVINIIRRG